MSDRGEASVSGNLSDTAPSRDVFPANASSPLRTGGDAPTFRASPGAGARIVARRRRGAPPAVFYVHAAGADGEDGTGDSQAAGGAAALPEKGGAGAGAEDGDGMFWAAQRAALEAVAQAFHALQGIVPVILHPTPRGKWNISAGIFVFFLAVLMILVGFAQRQMRLLTGVLSYENEQTLVVAAGVTMQLHAKANEAKGLVQSGRKASMAEAKREDEVRELTQLRDAVLRVLHTRIAYAGPVEDIEFLLNEHVVYEANLARIVREELQWLEVLRVDYLQKVHNPGAARGKNETGKNARYVEVVEATEQIEEETLKSGKETATESLRSSTHKKTFAVIILVLLIALYIRLA